MKKNIYKDLAAKVDEISFGFPKSKFGFDKALLKTIFTPEDAANWMKMLDGFQTAKEYADKNGISEEEATALLDSMAMRGLVYRRHRDLITEYKQYPFAAGMLEFQVNNSDNYKFLMNTAMYMVTSGWGYRMSQTMPFERAIPLNKEFVKGTEVLPFDDIQAILDKHTRFAVAKCICRVMYKLEPWNKCKHPLETCISTDDYATYYIETGIGREITKEEAYEILKQGEKDGRVISISNSKESENICSCCKCGCGMLYMKKKYPGPSADYWSNYYSVYEEDKCVGCGICEKRCVVDAIKFNKKTKKVTINQKACIGCGLCVSTCGPKALSLRRKDEDKLYYPPEDIDIAMDRWEEITVKDYKHGK